MTSTISEVSQWKDKSGSKNMILNSKRAQPNHSFNHTDTKKKERMPFLRLDSVGEITSGHNLCYNSKSYPKSKSFDSILTQDSVNVGLVGLNSQNHIPSYCPSFRKSVSIPSKMLANSSFPSFAENNNLSPFSPNPRLLGSSNIFKEQSFYNSCSSESEHTSSSFNINNNSVDSGDLSKDFPVLTSQQEESKSKCIKDADVIQGNTGTKVNKSLNYSSVDCVNISLSQKKDLDISPQKMELSTGIPIPKTKRKRRSRARRKKKKDLSSSFGPTSCSPVKDIPSHSSNIENVSSPCGSNMIASKNLHISSDNLHASNSISSPNVSFEFESNSCQQNTRNIDSDISFGDLSDDDLVFCESSVVFAESESPTPATSMKKKRKEKLQNFDFQTNDTSENESDVESEQKRSPVSALLMLSVTVSEDEENDSSVDWDLSASPCQGSDQFIFEFEFNTGLSLGAILGQSSSVPCPLSKEMKELNVRWNKFYDASKCDKLPCQTQNQPKVHFACDEDLVMVHIVGNEDRADLYAREKARFKDRIDRAGQVLAPILCASHREKVFEIRKQ